MKQRLHLLLILIISWVATSFAYAMPSIVINNDFKKSLDTTKLEKILVMNDSKAIIRVIQNDVDLYKTDFNSSNSHVTEIQKLLSELPLSTLNLKSILSSLDIQSLLGIFLPYEQLQNTNFKDTIIIREDAGLWTLIHEYMHFLFYEEKRVDHFPDPSKLQNIIRDSTETYNEEFSKYRINNKFINEYSQKNYTEALLVLCKYNIQSVLNFNVEEIIIEEQLQHKFKIDLRNNIYFLELKEYTDSNSYISKNLRLALNTTQYTLRLIEEAQKILPTESYKKIKTEIESYELKYKDILFELKKRWPAETKPAKPAEVLTA